MLFKHSLSIRRRDRDECQGRRAERHAQRHDQPGQQVQCRSDADDHAIDEQMHQYADKQAHRDLVAAGRDLTHRPLGLRLRGVALKQHTEYATRKA
jgi:hypothetical protein